MISIKNNKKLQLLIIVGAVLAVTAVVGVLVGTYCTGWSGFHFYDKPQDGDVKIACVGDSITYGFGVNNWGKNNYPKQLDTLLGEGYCVNNYGHSGATAQAEGDQPYYSYSEYEKSVEFDADILILMMGTNDSKPYNWVDEATFKAEYIKLINCYKEQNPDIRIILCTPATSYMVDDNAEGLTSFDISPERCDIIAGIVRGIALEYGYELVDINLATKNNPALFVDDLVHPNTDGATVIAKTIYNYLMNNKTSA